MKAKVSMLVFFILVSGIFLHSGVPQKRDTKKSQEQRETGSLIRKGLLDLQNKKFPSPRRNIFVRQRVSSQQNEISPASGGNFQMLKAEDAPVQEETRQKEIGFTLNYIGYVKSGDRVVALVLLEGETYAVESGDVLEGGLTVGDISPDDIEIIGSDSVLRRIKLEGERP